MIIMALDHTRDYFTNKTFSLKISPIPTVRCFSPDSSLISALQYFLCWLERERTLPLAW